MSNKIIIRLTSLDIGKRVPRHFLDGHISDRHFLDGHILDRAVWDTFQTSNRKGLILDRTLFRQSTKMDTF